MFEVTQQHEGGKQTIHKKEAKSECSKSENED